MSEPFVKTHLGMIIIFGSIAAVAIIITLVLVFGAPGDTIGAGGP